MAGGRSIWLFCTMWVFKILDFDDCRSKANYLCPSITVDFVNQIPRISRHCIPHPQEKILDFPALLPPRCNRGPLLHAINWPHSRVMGRDHPQPCCPLHHVLVLLPEHARCPCLVERMGHSATSDSVHDRPWIRLFCVLYIFRLDIFSLDAPYGFVCRRGVRGFDWHWRSDFISRAVSWILLCDV